MRLRGSARKQNFKMVVYHVFPNGNLAYLVPFHHVKFEIDQLKRLQVRARKWNLKMAAILLF